MGGLSGARLRHHTETLLPGVMMAFIIAAAARFVSDHYGAPAMLFALLLGMAFHFLSVEGKCVAGIQFTSGRLLKIGVALLGARVTFSEIASLGIKPVILVLILITLTILCGLTLARAFNRSREFGLLTGGAVAICGASAALAISSVLPQNEKSRRDTLFAVIAVTSLSTVAMIAYPVILGQLGFDESQIGILIGATIHDVAQVVGAGFAVSDEAGNVATYVKLLRVSWLPVVVILFAFLSPRDESGASSIVIPWFALAFAIILIINSLGWLPEMLRGAMEDISGWLLIAAIAALGMKTSLKAMADLGPVHIGIVVGETLFLFVAAVFAVKFL